MERQIYWLTHGRQGLISKVCPHRLFFSAGSSPGVSVTAWQGQDHKRDL